MQGTTRADRHHRRAVPGEAGDTVNARGLNRFGEGHRRQDGGEPPCQHRRARPRGTEEKDVMDRTPAFGSPEHAALGDVPAHGPPPTPLKPARLTALYPAGPA
jgi:hypothetical protein